MVAIVRGLSALDFRRASFARIAVAGLLAILAQLVLSQPAAAQSRWSSPSCSYSVEFPAIPDLRGSAGPAVSISALQANVTVSAHQDVVIADYVTGPGGSLSAGCALVSRPMSRGALQAMVYASAAELTPVRSTSGVCTESGPPTQCASMEAVLLVGGAPVMRSVVTARSDGLSVFFTRVMTPYGAPGAEFSEVERAFASSIAFIGVD